MKTIRDNTVVSQDQNSIVTVLAKFDHPHYVFVDLSSRYRSLMEFDIALIKEHYQQKEGDQDSHVFLHEPCFEIDIHNLIFSGRCSSTLPTHF